MAGLLGRLFQREKRQLPPCAVVIPAAGSATRMQGLDKIMMPIGDIPILVRTIQSFEQCGCVEQIIVVTREELIVPISQMCKDWGLDKVNKIVVGASARIHSVRLGLKEVRHDIELVAIHDGARPFLSQEVLEAVLLKGAQTGAAAPALPVIETIKQADGGVVTQTLERAMLYGVQTPQVFEASLIRGAIEKACSDQVELTDDCAAVERLGMKVSLTQGERENIKITTPLDLYFAEAILMQRGELR